MTWWPSTVHLFWVTFLNRHIHNLFIFTDFTRSISKFCEFLTYNKIMRLILIVKTFLSLIIIMHLINHLIILRIAIIDYVWLNSFHMLKRFRIILASIQIIRFKGIMILIIIIILLTNSFTYFNKLQTILELVLEIIYLFL